MFNLSEKEVRNNMNALLVMEASFIHLLIDGKYSGSGILP